MVLTFGGQNRPIAVTVADLELEDAQEAQQIRKNILLRFGIVMDSVELDHEAA